MKRCLICKKELLETGDYLSVMEENILNFKKIFSR